VYSLIVFKLITNCKRVNYSLYVFKLLDTIDMVESLCFLFYSSFQKEAAFHFKESSRCLVTPIDKRMFPGSAGELEMRAADFTFKVCISCFIAYYIFKLCNTFFYCILHLQSM